jgi:DNA-binding transcriptional LysR family regulator
MDLHRLEIFCKLMETRSFSKTGQELNLTQPTVSGHIKTLEEQIGLRLFDRHRRMVRPTSAALVLQEFAEKMLDMSREAGFALERFRGRIGGRLCLGGSTIPGTYIMPQLIGKFHRIYPETELRLVLDDTTGLVARVAEGEVEVGLVGALASRENVILEPVLEDQMVLVAPPDHRWASSGKPVKVKNLAETPFIIREEGSGTRAAMLESLKAHGLSLEDLMVVAEMGSTEAVRQSVKSGLGVSILSRVAVDDLIKMDAVRVVAVTGLNLKRRFYLAYHGQRTRSPASNAFMDFLRNEARSMGAISNGGK